jgi:hypothetical protein
MRENGAGGASIIDVKHMFIISHAFEKHVSNVVAIEQLIYIYNSVKTHAHRVCLYAEDSLPQRRL